MTITTTPTTTPTGTPTTLAISEQAGKGRRSWLPALALAVAGGAAALSVVAITNDDVSSVPPAVAEVAVARHTAAQTVAEHGSISAIDHRDLAAVAERTPGPVRQLDACGRPIVDGRASCD